MRSLIAQLLQCLGRQVFKTEANIQELLIAVREIGVSRHQGDPIEVPAETPLTSQHYRIEGIKEI